MRRRGAKSFVDDLVLSRGVVLSRADLFCDLLRLSPMTRRFVRFRRTYLRHRSATAGHGHSTVVGRGYFSQVFHSVVLQCPFVVFVVFVTCALARLGLDGGPCRGCLPARPGLARPRLPAPSSSGGLLKALL